MNNERAIELLEQIKNNALKLATFVEIQEPESEEILILQKQIQALDLAIESLKEDKVTLLYCVEGKLYVVDSEKSLDELSSESCDKCKRNEELDEIRKDFNFEPHKESDKE